MDLIENDDVMIRMVFSIALLLVASTASAGSVVVPADVSINLTAEPSAGLISGQPITFTISATNHGPNPVESLGVWSSHFTTEFNLAGASSDCSNGLGLAVVDGKDFYYFLYNWRPTLAGTLQVGETRICQLTLPLSSSAPATFPFSFGISNLYLDDDPSNNSATVTLRRAELAESTSLPTLSPLALALLAGLFVLAGGMAALRRTGR